MTSMKTAGSAAFPASILLARRGIVQHTPFHGAKPVPFDDSKVAGVNELSKGFLVTSEGFAEALRAQQVQAAQDMRDLGFVDAANRAEQVLGVTPVRGPREH